MELEYADPGRRGRFIVVIGLILAILGGAAAFYVISQAQQQAARGDLPSVAIVVAARDIAARKPIDASDIAVRQVPLDPTNEKGVFSDPATLIGLIPGVTIQVGQPVFANMLVGQTQGSQFSIFEPTEAITANSPTWRAISVTVPDERAVGGMLEAGQTVDIFVTAMVDVPDTLVESGTYYSDRSTKIVYQDVLILAKTPTAYVLRTTLPVAEEISHLQASGAASFSMALRSERDLRPVDASSLGVTTNLIMERYGLPIPQPYPRGFGPASRPSPSPQTEPEPATP
jgi:Flp pilus assembly protein CpaB